MKYLLILFIFISCSPQKRISRLLKKHPSLIGAVDYDTTIRDTIHEIDTFVTKEYKDSFIIVSDTVIKTDRLVIERFKDKFRVIVRPDTFIRLDTIFHERTITVKGKTLTKEVVPQWVWLICGASGICLLLVIVK